MTCRLRREFRRYAGTSPLTRSSSHLGSAQNAKSCQWTDGPNENGASTASTDREKNGEILVMNQMGPPKWGCNFWGSQSAQLTACSQPLLNRTNSHDLIR